MNVAANTLVHSPTAMAPESSLPDIPRNSGLTQSQSQDMANTGSASARRRRPSKSMPDSALKRSASTPNVRGSSQSDMPASLSAEKRRNKLGYHRTSVACGKFANILSTVSLLLTFSVPKVHCRRRKIRCLAAPDDPQNRCANCIRLRKDCQFYPVDQQAAQERRPRAGSKVEIKSGENSSSSSSPGFTAGTSNDPVENFNQFPLMPINTHPFSGPLTTTDPVTMSPPGSAGLFAFAETFYLN
jgi:hypothetical protein